MDYFSESYWIARLLFQKGLGILYFIGFLVAFKQFKALLGARGLLPVPKFLKRVSFKRSPSIFHFYYSDKFAEVISFVGMVLSAFVIFGLTDIGPLWFYILVWFLMWVIYLSFVNVGQTFYAFGWESLLLEVGFLAIFMGPFYLEVPVLIIYLLRWVLFRLEFGAGLIKMRGDQCWKDLTCLYYHYETQPMTNPLSWYFHQLPKWFHRLSVFFSHFVQLIVPIFLFFPHPYAAIAASLIIVSQLWLIVSGNFSWLNWITIVLAFSGFSDGILGINVPMVMIMPVYYEWIIYGLFLMVFLMSIPPILNMFSKRQLMNFSFTPLHLVNTYGAFGSITKKRMEIIIEGTSDEIITDQTIWKEYEFKGKPGNIKKNSPQYAPYHLRLDWLMWFAAMGTYQYYPWIQILIQKFLEGDKQVLNLIKYNPFQDIPPKFIRARLYDYQFTNSKEKKLTGNYWKREFVVDYYGPISKGSLL